MKNLLHLLILSLLTISLSAQPSIEWQKALGGSDFDKVHSTQQTTDGGYSWQRLRNGNSVFKPRLHFTDVHFTDTQNGYVLGNKLLWLTADGGNTFIQHQLSCDMPNSIAFKNENF